MKKTPMPRARITIEIDAHLMARAMRVSGAPTKQETVERALKLMIALAEQERVRQFRGKLKWEGDLDHMRRDYDNVFDWGPDI